MSTVDWGSVPDWIAAIGTAGALVLGLGILARDSRNRRAESDRLGALDEDRRREQASNVSGLVVEDRIQLAEGAGPISTLTAIAHNGSTKPIYNVAGLVIDVLTREPIRSVGFVDVLPGGHRSNEDVLGLLQQFPPSDTNHYLLELSFTDSAGLRWRRLIDGQLSRVSSPAAGAGG